MIDLTAILIIGAYRLEDIAVLFNLPKFEIETQFGPGQVRSADLIARANLYQGGGSNSIDPARPTTDTAVAFRAATMAYALSNLLSSFATYSNAQLAALFAVSSDSIAAILGSGPTTGPNVVTAAASYPNAFPFANVTATTVAAFRAA
jgi:hypothetical protein